MISPQTTAFLLSLGGIILVDLILSGDNALVIGAAAAQIRQRRQRWLVLILGGLAAIVLRILFTTTATFLLGIPYLQALGGLLVLFIAIRLILEDPSESKGNSAETNAQPERAESQLPALARFFAEWARRRSARKTASPRRDFIQAITTIMIADLTMSLDNIVAIGALAHQQVGILIIGLSLSILLLIIGSALVSELISRVPWLIVIASFILAWVACDLVWNDLQNLPIMQNDFPFHLSLLVLFLLIVLVFTLITRRERVLAAIKLSR